MDNILRLVGLAKRGGNLEAGEEPVAAAARARDARVILVARDAAENTYRRVRHIADAGQCIWLSVPYDKDELGLSIGRTSCAMVAITDVGLASAIVERLAAMDPEKYAISAERMALKAQRAMERRAEAARHEKNLRSGKKKHIAPPPPPPEEERRVPRPGVPAAKKPPRPPAPPGGESRPPHGEKRRTGSGPKRGGPGPHGKSPEQRFAHSRPVKKGKGSVKKRPAPPHD